MPKNLTGVTPGAQNVVPHTRPVEGAVGFGNTAFTSLGERTDSPRILTQKREADGGADLAVGSSHLPGLWDRPVTNGGQGWAARLPPACPAQRGAVPCSQGWSSQEHRGARVRAGQGQETQDVPSSHFLETEEKRKTSRDDDHGHGT